MYDIILFIYLCELSHTNHKCYQLSEALSMSCKEPFIAKKYSFWDTDKVTHSSAVDIIHP